MDLASYSEQELSVCAECQIQKPTEPFQSDCCGTGCTPCVFDLYQDDLKKWSKRCLQNHGNEGTDQARDGQPSILATFTKFKLVKMTWITSDTCLYRFRVPENRNLGLSIGQHIVVRGVYDGRCVTRQYTPVSPLDSRGFFDVFIKIYKDGRMSQHVKDWKVGQSIEWRGPYGDFTYSPNQYKHLTLLAAGTGLAPMLQVIRCIVNNEHDEAMIQLVYATQTYKHILVKPLLDEFASFWNVSVLYILSKDVEENVKSKYGEQIRYRRLDKRILEEELKAVLCKTFFLICGPKSFDKDMIKYLKELDVDDTKYFKF